MRARRTLIAVLFVATCARQIIAVGHPGYAPKWHVGDWWEVKTWCMSPAGGYDWAHTRSKVKGVEEVAGRECYVIETRNRLPSGALGKCSNVWYVRKDDWLVVRQVITTTFQDTLCPPVTTEAPLGMFGPFQGGEPRLPGFPLDTTNKTDTLFRLRERYDGPADLREISRLADTELVKRLLAEGDTGGGRIVRPRGTVYEVRSELAGNFVPGSLAGKRDITQSRQLWSEDLPWRVFEEFVQYNGPNRTRVVSERSWLVAVGHGSR